MARHRLWSASVVMLWSMPSISPYCCCFLRQTVDYFLFPSQKKTIEIWKTRLFHFITFFHSSIMELYSFIFQFISEFDNKHETLLYKNSKVEHILLIWLRGAMVARLTPDQKAACSNHVGVINILKYNSKWKYYNCILQLFTWELFIWSEMKMFELTFLWKYINYIWTTFNVFI